MDKKVVYFQKHSLNHNDFTPEVKPAMLYDENRNIVVQVISNVTEKDGKLVVEVPGIKAKSGNLEVIRLKEGVLTLMEKHKNSIYNYILLTEESDLVKTALKNAADK